MTSLFANLNASPPTCTDWQTVLFPAVSLSATVQVPCDTESEKASYATWL